MEEEIHQEEHLIAEKDLRATLHRHFDNDECRMQVLADVL